MFLYQLTDQFRGIQDLMERDDADLGDLEITLAGIEGEIGQKVDNIAALITHFERMSEAAAAEKARLAKREAFYDARAERLTAYLQRCLEEAKIDKPLVGQRFTVGLHKCPPSIEVTDINLLAEWFLRTKETVEPDKRAILEFVKSTGEIPGGVNYIDDKRKVSIR